MHRVECLEGLRMLKFRSVLERWESAELSQLEAAALLGVGERTFRRWRSRYREGGEAGLLDRRLGEAAANRVPSAAAAAVAALYRERYVGFTAKHFHEHLVRDHGFRWGYTWTKLFLQGRGLLVAAPRRGAHRRKRPRRPLVGMMLHQDASSHSWLVGQPACDLVVTLDDATSAIYSAILVPEEGTASSFAGLLDTPEQAGTAFVAVPGVDLVEVLCHQEERQVGNDNTVVFQRVRLQIPPSPLRAHYVRATVKVRRYQDGSHAVFHGPRCIGRYDATGCSLADQARAA